MNVLEGKLIASELRLGIVVGRFNEFIGSKLLDGAIDAAVRHGVMKEDITVAWVPGAFEIPLVAKKSGKPVIFGVLTTDTIEQAIERAGTKAGNKGAEAVNTAIEMVNLLEKIG